jgi:hypothetical protein
VSVPKNRKYVTILESNLTEIGAWALERRLIRWYGRKDLNTGILRNKTDGGPGAHNPSESARKHLSIVSTGRLVSEKTRAKLRALRHTEETKERLRISSIGRQVSEKTRTKLRALRHTEETKKAIGLKSKNQIRKPTSEDTKKKLRVLNVGDKNPAWGMGYNTGRTLSEETKLKIGKKARVWMTGKKPWNKNKTGVYKLTDDQKLERSATWLVTHPCGKMQVVVGLVNFTKEHDLCLRLMRRVASGRRKSHKGYKITKIEGAPIYKS